MNEQNPIDNTHETNLLELWRVMVRRWKMIAVLFFASTLTTLIISLLLPKIYQAKATLLPLESPEASLSATLAALGGIAGEAGVSIGKSTPAEKFEAVLKSRTLAENVIQKLNLLPELFAGSSKPATMEDGVKRLKDLTQIHTDIKSDLVSVAAE